MRCAHFVSWRAALRSCRRSGHNCHLGLAISCSNARIQTGVRIVSRSAVQGPCSHACCPLRLLRRRCRRQLCRSSFRLDVRVLPRLDKPHAKNVAPGKIRFAARYRCELREIQRIWELAPKNRQGRHHGSRTLVDQPVMLMLDQHCYSAARVHLACICAGAYHDCVRS